MSANYLKKASLRKTIFFEEQNALVETQATSNKSSLSSSFLKKSTLDPSECHFLSTSLFFSVSLFFCPPECFNSLCNFLLLPTLKSERRRLGKGKKSDLQHMIAEHYTEVSLRNSQNISAYQLQGDVTGFIFGCEPDNTFDSPSLRGSESEEGRLDVWGGKRQRRCVQWGEKKGRGWGVAECFCLREQLIA